MENREIKFRAWEEFPRYQVGDDGSVYSLNHNHSGKRKVMKQALNEDGYAYVQLVVNAKRHKRLVHRMVATCFVDNPSGKPQVNHLNGRRADNRAANLEWVTSKENTIHGFVSNGRQPSDRQREHGRQSFAGDKNPKAKINEVTALSIRRLRAKGKSLKAIAERHGISVAQVSAIARGKFWKS